MHFLFQKKGLKSWIALPLFLAHQVQFHEMGEPMMKKPRRPRQARPHDEELERQIRMLLVSNFDEAECKTTWSCAQCNYSNKLQYTVKKANLKFLNDISIPR